MKILQVIPFFSPLLGGSVWVPYNLSYWLAKEGHEITIITTDYRYDPDFAQSLENVKVIPFDCIAHVGQFFYSPEMKRWLKENISTYNIVHLHNFRSYQNNIVSKYSKKYNIPYIIQPHGSLPRIVEKKGIKWLYDIVWGKEILKHAKMIIAVSQCELNQFRQAGISDEKIIIIPNGIESSENSIDRGQFRKDNNIREKFIVLYVGRLNKRKGIEHLIHAFHHLIKSMGYNDIALAIVGPDDGYRSVLEKLINDFGITNKVRILGYISSLSEAYFDADVLVYPAISEIFGLVPFEALLCGAPVIVSDDCGCGEIVKGAKCGYLFKYGDVIELSKKIEYVLEHPEENKEKVLAGQKFIKENLVWDKIVIKMEKMYARFI